jgi:hypothetical protein
VDGAFGDSACLGAFTAIVDNIEAPAVPTTAVGSGIYVGLAASIVLVLFGLTIVIKRASTPYARPEDDD